MAGHPLPRLFVNPALRDVVRACGTPGWLLAIRAGVTHYSKFSILVNSESIPASLSNIESLERIAAAVGFDKSRLFVDGDLCASVETHRVTESAR